MGLLNHERRVEPSIFSAPSTSRSFHVSIDIARASSVTLPTHPSHQALPFGRWHTSHHHLIQCLEGRAHHRPSTHRRKNSLPLPPAPPVPVEGNAGASGPPKGCNCSSQGRPTGCICPKGGVSGGRGRLRARESDRRDARSYGAHFRARQHACIHGAFFDARERKQGADEGQELHVPGETACEGGRKRDGHEHEHETRRRRPHVLRRRLSNGLDEIDEARMTCTCSHSNERTWTRWDGTC